MKLGVITHDTKIVRRKKKRSKKGSKKVYKSVPQQLAQPGSSVIHSVSSVQAEQSIVNLRASELQLENALKNKNLPDTSKREIALAIEDVKDQINKTRTGTVNMYQELNSRIQNNAVDIYNSMTAQTKDTQLGTRPISTRKMNMNVKSGMRTSTRPINTTDVLTEETDDPPITSKSVESLIKEAEGYGIYSNYLNSPVEEDLFKDLAVHSPVAKEKLKLSLTSKYTPLAEGTDINVLSDLTNKRKYRTTKQFTQPKAMDTLMYEPFKSTVVESEPAEDSPIKDENVTTRFGKRDIPIYVPPKQELGDNQGWFPRKKKEPQSQPKAEPVPVPVPVPVPESESESESDPEPVVTKPKAKATAKQPSDRTLKTKANRDQLEKEYSTLLGGAGKTLNPPRLMSKLKHEVDHLKMLDAEKRYKAMNGTKTYKTWKAYENAIDKILLEGGGKK